MPEHEWGTTAVSQGPFLSSGNRDGCRTQGARLAKQESVQVQGKVTEVLPDQKFRVELENGHMVLAYAAGRMSRFRIRVLVGDLVTLDLSPYDLSKGRITFRFK